MKLGAEPKKLIILGVLVAGALFLYLTQDSTPGPAPSSAPAAKQAAPAAREAVPAQVLSTTPRPAIRRTGGSGRTGDEWHPTMKRRPDDKTDPMSIDPTLRLDLLAKVQAVDAGGGGRSIFAFSAPPPPPMPKGPEPRVLPKAMAGGAEPPASRFPSGPPQPPPPPPINLKYFGYSAQRGAAHRTAFFLDGDDILVASEGETVKRRYRVVKIGNNSVVMEDTESKSQQTLPLAPEAAA